MSDILAEAQVMVTANLASYDRRLARVFPYRSSPRIPAHFLGSDRQIPETYRSINDILVARAASLGFREVERSRYHFSRIIGELTETLLESDEFLSEETIALPYPEWIAEARTEAAIRYRDEAIRDSMLESGNFRRARFFAWGDEGPTSCVSWLRWAGVDAMAESMEKHARLAAGFDLDFSWAAPFWCSESHALALEIHKPGRSVLKGWRLGDMTYCDFDSDDPGPSPEAA